MPSRTRCHAARTSAMLLLGGALLAAAVVPALAADAPTAGAAKVYTVEKTFNDAPFEYRMELTARRSGYRIYRLTYPSPVTTPVAQNNTVPADYYLPDGIEPGDPKRPAVICIHILNGNFELVRILCSSLASRGVPAVMFKLPYYGERSLPGGQRELGRNPKLFVQALPQGIQDARRTIDLLASRPEIDADRIGISGISLGGIVAATTAGADPRLSRAALILAGGDLLGVIHHCREARELSQFLRGLPDAERTEMETAIRGVDPLSSAAGLKDRAAAGRVLMINAGLDNVIPRAATEKLAAALGMADRVVWLEGLGHYTAIAALPQILQQTVAFFAADLPPGTAVPVPVKAAGGTPAEVLARLVAQAAGMVANEPSEGCCNLVDLEVKVTEQKETKYEGRLRFVRGTGRRFAVELDAPFVDHVSLGQGDYPWMASAKTAFCGWANKSEKPQDPLALADPVHLARLRAAAGAAGALVFAPNLLEQAATIAESKNDNGSPVLTLTPKGKKNQTVRLVMQADRKTPKSATFDVDGVRGEITFRTWQADAPAHNALFKPAEALKRQEVDESDILRIFAAMFNFAMEQIQ